MLTTLDRFGRVLVPKKLRKLLGFNADTSINIIEDSRRIILEPAKEEEPIIEKNGLLIYTGKLQDGLNQELKLDPSQRIECLLYTGE